MADRAEDLAADLRIWASTENNRVRAAVSLLIKEGWHRRADFTRACVRDDAGQPWIRWDLARAFHASNPVGSSAELAILDMAVLLTEDRFRLGGMGAEHLRWVADAWAIACGLGGANTDG